MRSRSPLCNSLTLGAANSLTCVVGLLHHFPGGLQTAGEMMQAARRRHYWRVQQRGLMRTVALARVAQVGVLTTWVHKTLTLAITLTIALITSTTAFAQPPQTLNGDLLATKAFRSAAKRVAPALVTVEAIGVVKEDIQAVGRPATLRATGGVTTGLVLSSDGYILTSTFGLGEKAPAITVVLRDGSRHLAKELGRDVGRKLCLLKVEGVANLPICEYVAREQVRVGQWVVAVGLGLGEREPSISSGIISATHRIGRRAIQTDANTSPVNYGGPLVDLHGRVVGLCVPLTPGDGGGGSGVEWYDSGIGFAIPIAGLDSIIERLKKGETLVPGFMGVQIDPTSDEKSGAKVKEVVKEGPAEKAGLKPGDVLASVEGNEVTDAQSLHRIMGEYLAGQKVKLQIIRAGEKKEIEVTLGVRPPPPPPMPIPMPVTPMPMPPEKPPEEKKPDEKKPEEKKPEEKRPEEKPAEKP